MGQQIPDEYLLLFLPLLLGAQPEVQAHDQRGHEVTLLHIPQPLGEIAHHCLEEEHEAHPLIVRVILGRRAVLGADSRMSGTHALYLVVRVRHGERGRYPTVRVHRLGGQAVHYALYRVAHELRGRHYDGTGQQHHRGERDVHPEHGAIDGHRLPLDELLEAAQQFQHDDEDGNEPAVVMAYRDNTLRELADFGRVHECGLYHRPAVAHAHTDCTLNRRRRN